MQQSPEKATTRQQRKEARPGELINVALDLFAEHGYAATRVEDVAAQAGVSKGTVYLYFPTKEELFKAVVRETILPALAEGQAYITRYAGTSTDLLRIYLEWRQQASSGKLAAIGKLVMLEASNFPDIAEFYYQEVVLPFRRLLQSILARGVETGEFRAMDVDYMGQVINGALGYADLWQHSIGAHPDFGLDTRRYYQAQLDLILHGLMNPQAA